jgi:hypothetical protein
LKGFFAQVEGLPGGQDREDLIVEAGGAISEEREAAQEDDAALRLAGDHEDGAGEVVVDKALGEEAAEQALDEAVLQVQVDGAVVEVAGGMEGDGPDREASAPLGEGDAAGPRRAEGVEGLDPGGVASEVGGDGAEIPANAAVGRGGLGRRRGPGEAEGSPEGGLERPFIEAQVVPGSGEDLLQRLQVFVDLLGPTSIQLLVPFLLDPGVVLGLVEAVGELVPLPVSDASIEEGGQASLDDLALAAEFFLDGEGAADQDLEDVVLGALEEDEVVTVDDGSALELAVDTAVALLHAGGVPGDVEVKEVGAVVLEVDALAGRVGGDEDAERRGARILVEGVLDLLAGVLVEAAVEGADAVLDVAQASEGLGELAEQVILGGRVLGEEEDAAVTPALPFVEEVLPDPAEEELDPRVREVACVLGDAGHLVEELELLRGDGADLGHAGCYLDLGLLLAA